MPTPNHKHCYDTLELSFGANLKQVEAAWKRLSKLNHPDQFRHDKKKHEQALEKQKQLNHSRDLLKAWLEAKSGQADSPSSGNPSSKRENGTAETKTSTGQKPQTDWFPDSKPESSFCQELLLAFASLSHEPKPDKYSFLLLFSPFFGSIWLAASTINLLFPWLAGHYPDWLVTILLAIGFGTTVFLFSRSFWEVESQKIQKEVLYFKTTKSPAQAKEKVQSILTEQQFGENGWTFRTNDSFHEAHFAPTSTSQTKSSIVVRFAIKKENTYTIIGMQIRIKNQFCIAHSCKTAQMIIKSLKAQPLGL